MNDCLRTNTSDCDLILILKGTPLWFTLSNYRLIDPRFGMFCISQQVKSKVRLFADDTAMFLTMSSLSEASILLDDLIHLKSGKNPVMCILTPQNARSCI